MSFKQPLTALEPNEAVELYLGSLDTAKATIDWSRRKAV